MQNTHIEIDKINKIVIVDSHIVASFFDDVPWKNGKISYSKRKLMNDNKLHMQYHGTGDIVKAVTYRLEFFRINGYLEYDDVIIIINTDKIRTISLVGFRDKRLDFFWNLFKSKEVVSYEKKNN